MHACLVSVIIISVVGHGSMVQCLYTLGCTHIYVLHVYRSISPPSFLSSSSGMGNYLMPANNNNNTGSEGNVHIAGVGNDIETGASGVQEANIGMNTPVADPPIEAEMTPTSAAGGGGGGGGELPRTVDPPIRDPEQQPMERKIDIDMLTKIAAAILSVIATVTLQTTQDELFSKGVLGAVYRGCLVMLLTLGVILFVFTFVGTVVRDTWRGAVRAIANAVAWALLFLLLLLAAFVIYAVVA